MRVQLVVAWVCGGLAFPPALQDAPRPAIAAEVAREPEPTQPAIDPADAEDAGAIANETERGTWGRDAIMRVRARLRPRHGDATRILRLAGFDERTSRTLGATFGAPDEFFERRVGRRELLVLGFVKIGAADWEMTPETRENWRLPFHPRLPSRLAPSTAPARGQYERCDAVGEVRFDSLEVAPALRCTLVFRDHRFALTIASDLMRDDWSFADRIDTALSNVPSAHLAMVREIVLDPGDDASGGVAGTTTSGGTRINLFLAGAGKDVPQEQLDTTTVHEVGHVVSVQQDEDFWARWVGAMAGDRLFASCYAQTNAREDFAETYLLYLAGGRTDDASRARLPRRFALLDRLFEG